MSKTCGGCDNFEVTNPYDNVGFCAAPIPEWAELVAGSGFIDGWNKMAETCECFVDKDKGNNFKKEFTKWMGSISDDELVGEFEKLGYKFGKVPIDKNK